MGIGDFISDITPDSVEDAVEGATEWVGNRVEDAGDWTADRLDDVGWESGADWVREKSRSVADRMGAEADEMDLGQTEDKTKLIYGSPDKLRSTATHLRAFRKAFNNVGLGLEGLDSDSLKGRAADAFREAVKIQPPKWYKGSDAFEDAAKALESFADTVTWAQGQAQLALDKWKDGTKASEDAADAHKKKVDDYNKAVDRYNAQTADKRDPSQLPPRPGETFPDPGESLRKEAQDILTEARRQRNAAAGTARSAVTGARDAAPPKPSYAQQAGDGLDELDVMQTHFGGGIIKGTAGLVNFVRGLDPMDPYNLTHPAEYAMSLNSTAAGLVQVANDPWGAGKQMLSDFMKDPAEGFGRLVPDVVLTAATGGAGAGVKGARTAEELADAANTARRAEGLEDAGSGARRAEDLTDPSREPNCKCTGREPVDFATGRMFLLQQDVLLPGSLPLIFRRDFESSYRAGRWFGPTWSSTVDQRLTVDAIGVVFHGEDNLLLSYPHPAPGIPVLPEAGPRRPLERHPDGSYTLIDPETGLTRYFLNPDGAEPGGDGTALLTKITDRCGRAITADYDEHGKPLALTHSDGYRLEFSTENGRITALRSQGTELVRYGYEDGHLTQVTKSSGVPTLFEYDAEGRIVAWTDTNSSGYTFAYDDQDRCVSQTGVEGHLASEFHYGEPHPGTGLRTTTVTDSLGRTWHYTVNRRLQVIAETDPTGATVHTVQDRYNRVLSRTDALGRTTTVERDGEGRPVSVTRPDGSVVTARRGPFGLPVELTAADGARWTLEYDDRGNRIAVIDPAGGTSRYTYDEHGHPTSFIDPLGAATLLRHDAAGLLTERVDPMGGTTRYRRDAFGRIVEHTDPTGARTLLDWTPEGRLARRTGPDGATESWTYDGEGNCLSHTDVQGRTTRYEYTHFDLLTARTTDDGERHEFTYDTELRLRKVTNPLDQQWSYEYDLAGRLVSEADFDGRIRRYELDVAGQHIATVTPLDAVISYEYDPMGRVVRKDAAGEITEYAYDAAGRLLQATGPQSELIYQYDRRGNVKTELSDGHVTAYWYDRVGRRVRRMTPSGATTAYEYDAAGRLSALDCAGHRIALTHDAAGRELAREFGDALALTSAWDAAGRLAEQHLTASSTGLVHRAYAYQPDGYLVASHDSLRGTRRFTLDGAGRVTGVSADGWRESYAYDAVGNQTAAACPDRYPGAESTGERTYQGTRIERAGTTRYRHDPAGRLIGRTRTRLSRKPDTWTYVYDAEDRLVGVTTPDGTRWRYRYDPLGRRTAKQRLAADGATVVEETLFSWDGSILAEQLTTATEWSHAVVLTWDHRGRTPLAQTERRLDAVSQREVDARFFAIATDLIGTPSELIDDTGHIAWHTRTTLWGTTTWNANATAYTPLRFPGQYFDPETGLHYNLHRYYDPETARYTSADPLGLGPAPNPTAYVSNPHTWSDPLGLTPCPRDGVSNRERPPVEGDTNYQVDNPNDLSDTITDIDRIEDGVLWEEKTATGAHPNMNYQKWIAKNVDGKLDAYVRARQYLPGYTNAPIGMSFTEPGATPAFRSAVESAIDNWRAAHPGVDVRIRWAD